MNAAPLESAQLTARVPQALFRAARLAALAADVPFTTWVREAVVDHLAACQRRKGPRAVRAVDRNAPHSHGNADRSVTKPLG